MANLAFSLERRQESTLLPGALAHGHVVVARVQTAGELGAALAAREIELAVVSATRLRLTGQLVAAAHAAGTRLVVLAESDDERAVAAAAGCGEVLPEPGSWGELEQLLANRAVPVAGDGGASRAGHASVIAVWGPTGAPGRTSLAISIAAELADLGHDVALLDADTYGGSVAIWLGLLDETPGFAAACRLAGNEALTRPEFDRVAQYVPLRRGALAVLTGVARASRWPELGSERVTRTIDSVAGWFDHVVIDAGFNLETDEEIASDFLAPRRNAATLAALERATQLVSVGLGDPIGLSRLMRLQPEARTAAPGARHTVVVNRVRPGPIGSPPESRLTHALHRFAGITPAAHVPDDPAAFDAALLQGVPLVRAAPRSAARTAIRALVEGELLGLEPVRSRRARRRDARTVTAQVGAAASAATLDLRRVNPQ